MAWTNAKSLLSAALLSAFFLTAMGCTKLAAPKPEGFAAYRHAEPFHALSPEGVMYKVHLQENEPPAGLEFWQEALVTRMKQAGYRVVLDSAFTMGEQPGALVELAAPLGDEDYSYLIAIAVFGEKIAVAEAAGTVVEFAKHRDAVLKAMGAVRIP